MPHWQTAHDRLLAALRAEGMGDVEPILERVETAEEAERLRFIGSPTPEQLRAALRAA